MNEALRSFLVETVNSATLRHHCAQGDVRQIGCFHGTVNLTEMTNEKVTLGTYQHGNGGFIFMFTESIIEIQADYNSGKKRILPKVILSCKANSKKSRLQPGKLDRIELGEMSEEFFEIFIKLQRLIYQYK
jgi:hypothetical protein